MSQTILDEFNSKCEDAIDHLHHDFSKIQTGRASTALVEDILVDSYGSKMPMKGMATITTPESRQIAIQPFSRDQLPNVEKAIMEANIGLVPQNDGNYIRLNIPQLTEDRRKELVKVIYQYAEQARISIRNSRHEAISSFKALEKAGEISEDELRGKEKRVQEKVDEFNKKVEEGAKKKEGDLMTV